MNDRPTADRPSDRAADRAADRANGRDDAREPLASLFKLLGDGTRLNILLLLADGERNVSSLCDELRLPQPTVSHHLGLLRMNGVIANRRAGKQVFYALDGRVDQAGADRLELRVDDYVVTIAPRGDRQE